MKNPNATVAAGSAGAGTFLVWFLGNVWPHVDLSAEDGAVIAGALGTALLFLGRHGLKGVLGMFWKGDGA